MELDFLAVLVAALVGFGAGALWYSPLLFAKAWAEETGITEEKARERNPAMTFGVSFVITLIGAAAMDMFLDPDTMGVLGCTLAGLCVGLVWVGGSVAINYLFEHKSMRHWLITGGYHTIQYTLIGLILGLMS